MVVAHRDVFFGGKQRFFENTLCDLIGGGHLYTFCGCAHALDTHRFFGVTDKIVVVFLESILFTLQAFCSTSASLVIGEDREEIS